jgi:hypothetical protein
MSNDIRKYIGILTEDANLNQKYYTKDGKPDLGAFPDIARASKDDNGNYGPFQQWLIDNKKTHREHYRSWKKQSPTPNAFTDTGMIQQYFDQNLDQFSEFIDWYEENKDRYNEKLSQIIDNFKIVANEYPEIADVWNKRNKAKAKTKIAEATEIDDPEDEREIEDFFNDNPDLLSILGGIDGVGIEQKLSREAAAIKRDQTDSANGEKPNADPSQTPPAPDPATEPDEGDFEPGSTQPADDFDDEREGNDLKNPYSDITVGPDGSLNKPKPGKREFDQEGNVVAKPKVPNQAPTGGSGIRNPFDGGTNTTPARDQSGIGNPFDGGTNTTSSAVQGQAGTADPENDVLPNELGGTNTTSTATTTPTTQSAATTPQQQQPPVPKPRPAAQPKYYPGVTEPDYNKSLRIAQRTLQQAQRKLSQGNLSNLDKMQAQTDVQRQNQLINMYQNDLLANPRTERGKLIHHRNMLNRSAVASGQAGDQKTRAGYKKQAAQVSQQLKTVKESRFTNLQNYINKL